MELLVAETTRRRALHQIKKKRTGYEAKMNKRDLKIEN
jgi:hypothetical protein